MYHFIDESHLSNCGSTQEDTLTDPTDNVVLTATLPEENSPTDNSDAQEYVEKELHTDMITKIDGGMIREVKVKLPNQV